MNQNSSPIIQDFVTAIVHQALCTRRRQTQSFTELGNCHSGGGCICLHDLNQRSVLFVIVVRRQRLSDRAIRCRSQYRRCILVIAGRSLIFCFCENVETRAKPQRAGISGCKPGFDQLNLYIDPITQFCVRFYFSETLLILFLVLYAPLLYYF